MDFDDIYRIANGLLVIFACVYAIRQGGRAERLMGWAYLIASVASTVSSEILLTAWKGIEYDQFVIDLVLLGCFFAALRTNGSFWALWITALQAISVAVHVSRLWITGAIPLGYMFAIQFATYPIVGLLVYGTRKQQLLRKRSASAI